MRHGSTRCRHGRRRVPPACRSRRAAQPRDRPGNSPRSSPRARCCYKSSVTVHHKPVGPDLRQRDATTLWLGLEEQDESTSPGQPSVSCTLSILSVSRASCCSCTRLAGGSRRHQPERQYASRCSFARSQLTRLQYRRRTRPERTPREDVEQAAVSIGCATCRMRAYSARATMRTRTAAGA